MHVGTSMILHADLPKRIVYVVVYEPRKALACQRGIRIGSITGSGAPDGDEPTISSLVTRERRGISASACKSGGAFGES